MEETAVKSLKYFHYFLLFSFITVLCIGLARRFSGTDRNSNVTAAIRDSDANILSYRPLESLYSVINEVYEWQGVSIPIRPIVQTTDEFRDINYGQRVVGEPCSRGAYSEHSP